MVVCGFWAITGSLMATTSQGEVPQAALLTTACLFSMGRRNRNTPLHNPGTHCDTEFLILVEARLKNIQAAVRPPKSMDHWLGKRNLISLQGYRCDCGSNDGADSDSEDDTYCPHVERER